MVAYVLLAIVLTWPLVLHVATHVAGDGSDDPALAWNLWWVPYSILQLNSRIVPGVTVTELAEEATMQPWPITVNEVCI